MSPAQDAAPRIGIGPHTKSEKRQNYVKAVEDAGGIPVIYEPKQEPSSAEFFLASVDGLILPGGDDVDPVHYCEPEHAATTPVEGWRDEIDLALARLACEKGVPTLCVCRGMQVLNVALDGTLIQHLPEVVGERIRHTGDEHHRVKLAPGSRLASILREDVVAPPSSHHQAVRDVAPGLEAVAHADDGTIEAVEKRDHPWLIGVQWHPERERFHPEIQRRLFDALVQAARESRARRAMESR